MKISLAQFEPNLGDLKQNINDICDILKQRVNFSQI